MDSGLSRLPTAIPSWAGAEAVCSSLTDDPGGPVALPQPQGIAAVLGCPGVVPTSCTPGTNRQGQGVWSKSARLQGWGVGQAVLSWQPPTSGHRVHRVKFSPYPRRRPQVQPGSRPVRYGTLLPYRLDFDPTRPGSGPARRCWKNLSQLGAYHGPNQNRYGLTAVPAQSGSKVTHECDQSIPGPLPVLFGDLWSEERLQVAPGPRTQA